MTNGDSADEYKTIISNGNDIDYIRLYIEIEIENQELRKECGVHV